MGHSLKRYPFDMDLCVLKYKLPEFLRAIKAEGSSSENLGIIDEWGPFNARNERDRAIERAWIKHLRSIGTPYVVTELDGSRVVWKPRRVGQDWTGRRNKTQGLSATKAKAQTGGEAAVAMP